MSETGAFPQVDPMGSASSAAIFSTTVVPDVLDLCRTYIARDAANVDGHGVKRTTLEALAAVGACGITVPKEFGGLGADVGVQREVAELLAGSDASTWFCWAQHHTPTKVAIEAGAVELATQLAKGELLAGVAFAHVRRPGPPNPVATRVDGGFQVNGTLDWVTGWDVVDRILMVIAIDGEDAYLHAFITPKETVGLDVGAPLELLAMGGTHTRPVTLTDFFISNEEVVDVIDKKEWHDRDDVATAAASPAVFGLIRASIAELAVVGMRNSDRGARDLSRVFAEHATELRKLAYECTDVELNLQYRAQALALAERATDAVVNAYAGAAMRTGHVAGRRVREARFMMVQAQTKASRAAWTENELTSYP